MKYADKLLLYAVTDRSWLGGKTLYEEVEHAIQGGVTLSSYGREETGDTAFLKEAQEIQKLCKNTMYRLSLIDNAEIAAFDPCGRRSYRTKRYGGQKGEGEAWK